MTKEEIVAQITEYADILEGEALEQCLVYAELIKRTQEQTKKEIDAQIKAGIYQPN